MPKVLTEKQQKFMSLLFDQADGNVVVDKTSTFLGSRAGAKARAFDSALALVR